MDSKRRRLECSEAFDLGEGYEGLGVGDSALRVASREPLANDFELSRGEFLSTEPVEFVRDEGREPHVGGQVADLCRQLSQTRPGAGG